MIRPVIETRILYLFTRTPLHVGAGSSVGAIDQPIQRERHTGFPIIPASSLKGTFADEWNSELPSESGKKVCRSTDGSWLFGSDDAKNSCAGSVLLSEGKLLAFPIRSAKGSFAWITCPLMLNRYHRAKGNTNPLLGNLPKDGQAIFTKGGGLDVKDGQVVLENYTFNHLANDDLLKKASEHLKTIIPEDPVWTEVESRLIILSDGMMSYFAQNACEVAQHVKISDETGTAEGGALFNQENVPSEALFYSVINFLPGRGKAFAGKKATEARDEFSKKLADKKHVFQFGGDASTGLGYCTVTMKEVSL